MENSKVRQFSEPLLWIHICRIHKFKSSVISYAVFIIARLKLSVNCTHFESAAEATHRLEGVSALGQQLTWVRNRNRNKKQETRNKKQETETININKKQETRHTNRKQETKTRSININKKQETRSNKQETRNKKHKTLQYTIHKKQETSW